MNAEMLDVVSKLRIIVFIMTAKIFIIGGILIFMIFGAIALVGEQSDSHDLPNAGGLNLSSEVLIWEDEMRYWARRYEIESWVWILLAIMQVESRGLVPDLMQSSESAGLPVNTLRYEESIAQGVRYLARIIDRAQILNLGDDRGAIIQSYNFGIAYLDWLARNGERHSLQIAAYYSRTVVAPSLGNAIGERYDYINDVSMQNGMPWLYLNGGNFHYVYLVMQYVIPMHMGDEFFQELLEYALRYYGFPYVWGGSNPNTSFDCSGFTQWVFGRFGIDLPRTAQQQFDFVARIPDSEAKPGDLVFFEGTYSALYQITHLGIYVGGGQMLDSSSRGVGFNNVHTGFWGDHFVGFGRANR